MEKRFVMTAFAKDRPGIIAAVSRLIYETGCNLEDTTMTHLLDEFAMVILFSGKGDSLEEQLNQGCRRLEREAGISAFFRAVTTTADIPGTGERPTVFIEVEGMDQAGIVYKVTSFLAGRMVNIEHLSSTRRFSPESGAAIYSMTLEVTLPENMTVSSLDEGLGEIGEKLNVDISVKDQ